MSKKKLVFLKFLFITLSYAGLFLPLIIMFGMNWDKYIVQKEGLSVSFGGMTFCLMLILAMKFGFKKFNELFWSTLLLITIYSLNSIIQDALPLTFCFWLGTVIYKIFEIPMNYYKKRCATIIEETDRTYTRERVKKEIQNQEESGRC